MLAEAGAVGYALLFLVVGGPRRVEYGMSTAFCIGFAAVAVLFELFIACYSVGVGTMSETISYSAMAFLLVAAVGFARGRPTST